MLRAIAVIMAMGGCVLAGCSGAAKLKRRCGILTEMHAGIQRIRLGLEHTNRPVTALLRDSGGAETSALLHCVAQEIDDGCTPLDAWERAAAACRPALCGLTEPDYKVLSVFFSLLGGSDRCSQLQHADVTLKMLARQCAEARQLYEKNGRVYRTMGLLLGAGAAILLL